MKKITGLSNAVKVGNTPEMPPVKLLKTALENHPASLKGISNILTAMKLYEKLEDLKGDELDLEDTEFDLLYNAFNTFQWGGLILHCGQLIKELERVKKSA